MVLRKSLFCGDIRELKNSALYTVTQHGLHGVDRRMGENSAPTNTVQSIASIAFLFPWPLLVFKEVLNKKRFNREYPFTSENTKTNVGVSF